MSPGAARSILDAAWELGIRTFDTAEAYGEAPRRLAAWLDEREFGGEAHVVTKVRVRDAERISVVAAKAIERFAGCASVTLLTHGAAGEPNWSRFLRACDEHGVEPGQSVYTPDEVRAALQLPGVSRLQVPGNVFDRRAWTVRGSAPAALDVRSVFLQGVLLSPPTVAEEWVEGGGALARAVRNAADAVGESVPELLVAAAARLGLPGDRVVIGVDSPDQLVALVRASRVPEPALAQFCEQVFHEARALLTERLLDPRLW